MIAAFALLSLLAVSLAVIRVGGTALRLTGMSQDAARFQAISALTGTGFTTSEAETAMHHPVRRRILVMLMITGHLGVVSLISTVFLGVSTADDGALLRTLGLMAVALMAVLMLAKNAWLDRVMCAGVGHLLAAMGWFEKPVHLIMAELPDGSQLAEHRVATDVGPSLAEVADYGVQVLSLNNARTDTWIKAGTLKRGDRLLCCASSSAHTALSSLLQTPHSHVLRNTNQSPA